MTEIETVLLVRGHLSLLEDRRRLVPVVHIGRALEVQIVETVALHPGQALQTGDDTLLHHHFAMQTGPVEALQIRLADPRHTFTPIE